VPLEEIAEKTRRSQRKKEEEAMILVER